MNAAPFLACTLLIAGQAPAQDAPASTLSPGQATCLLEAIAELPIFAAPATEAGTTATRYALRERYKVELERSFLFVPALGAEAPENVPLRWTTRAIRRDGAALEIDANSSIEHGEWRYEIRQPAYTERYELREEGLELSWLLRELPAGAGDLFVEGRIETPARAAARDFEHGALAFLDGNGDAVLSYGAATAFDARGRSVAVASSWDGEIARLRVPAGWLAEAELPIVIDPLVAGPDFNVPSATGPLSSVEVLGIESAPTYKIFVAFTRAFSASDHDVYAAMMRNDLGDVRLVYSDVTTASSDRDVHAAYCRGGNRFVVATQRDYARAEGTFSGIRLYFHDRDDLVANHGLVSYVEAAPAASLSRPWLGGADAENASATRVLLVYQHDATTSRENTLHSEVYACPIDVLQRSVLSAYRAGAYAVGASYDRGHATVSPLIGQYNGAWVIAFLEIDRSVTGDDWDVRGTLTYPDGTLRHTDLLRDAGGTQHCVYPRVAGVSGHYVLVWGRTPNRNDFNAVTIQAQAFGWPTDQPAPTPAGPVRTIATTPSSALALFPGKLELDHSIDSLCGFTYLRGRDESGVVRYDGYAVQLGGSGGVVQGGRFWTAAGESAVMPSLAFSAYDNSWLVVGGSASVYRNFQTARLELTNMQPTQIVAGCGGTMESQFAYAGNAYYRIILRVQPNRMAVLILGSAPSALPLDGLGMNGCLLGVHPSSWIATFGQTTDAYGFAYQPLPLPDTPTFIGDFCAQWVFASPNANPLGLQTSEALTIHVR